MKLKEVQMFFWEEAEDNGTNVLWENILIAEMKAHNGSLFKYLVECPSEDNGCVACNGTYLKLKFTKNDYTEILKLQKQNESSLIC